MTLTFTEDGRKNVIDTSELLKDDITDNQVICLSFKMLLTIYFERRCEESQLKLTKKAKMIKKQLKHHHKNDCLRNSTVTKSKLLCIICA